MPDLKLCTTYLEENPPSFKIGLNVIVKNKRKMRIEQLGPGVSPIIVMSCTTDSPSSAQQVAQRGHARRRPASRICIESGERLAKTGLYNALSSRSCARRLG